MKKEYKAPEAIETLFNSEQIIMTGEPGADFSLIDYPEDESEENT